MRTIILSILLLFTISLRSQTKAVFLGLKDSSYLFNTVREYKLNDLIKSSNKLRIRYSSDTYAVEIWTNNSKIYNGTITLFTFSEYEWKSKHGPEHYKLVTCLDTAISRRVWNLFDSLSIFSIPEEDSIIPKNTGMLDGMDYNFEYSTPQVYSVKMYWSPDAFPDIKAEATLAYLIKTLDKQLGIHSSFNKFIGLLPKGAYSGGSIIGITKGSSPPRKIRLKSIEESK